MNLDLQPYTYFTPPTRTRQDSFVLSVSAAWNRHYRCQNIAQFGQFYFDLQFGFGKGFILAYFVISVRIVLYLSFAKWSMCVTSLHVTDEEPSSQWNCGCRRTAIFWVLIPLWLRALAKQATPARYEHALASFSEKSRC